MATATSQLQWGSVDDVPALWMERASGFTAGISFRVGSADERPGWRGLTHLLQHLVLEAFGRERVHLISQSSNDLNLTFVIDDADVENAGRVIVLEGRSIESEIGEQGRDRNRRRARIRIFGESDVVRRQGSPRRFRPAGAWSQRLCADAMSGF